jgi:Leucine-rich repeat (LRR) protein
MNKLRKTTLFHRPRTRAYHRGFVAAFCALLLAGLVGTEVSAQVTITPNTNNLILNEGDVVSETLTVNVPADEAVITMADIYFLADTTGSMGSPIASVIAGATDVMNSLISSFPDTDLAFGVGDYKDFPFDPYAFQSVQSLTTDTSVVQTAINGWSASGGNDGSEGQLYALDRLANEPSIGWRTGAKRIVVWFGDCPGHDPVPTAATELSYDITKESVTADLVAAGITVLAISTTTGCPNGMDASTTFSGGDYASAYGIVENSYENQATDISTATGGEHQTGVDSDVIVDTIESLISTAVSTINNLVLEPSGDAGMFVSLIDPAGGYGPLESTVEHNLDFDVEFTGNVPCESVDQVFTGTIDVVADGVTVIGQSLVVTVPSCSGTVQFTAATYNVTENSGQATITVTRSGNSQGAISVDYATSDDTATAGSDYTATSGTLNWADGDAADKTFTIDITDDSEVESNETLIISLNNVTGDAELGTPNTAVLTIIDNVPPTFNCATVTEISSEECQALVAIYNSTNGEQWNNNTGWTVTNTPCSWHGIQCKNGHVSRLYLQYNQLTGTIPPEIEGLTYLQVLNIRNNSLCGNIPAELMNLTQLWALSLENNHLSASDADLITWLNGINPGWELTQTTCPVPSTNTVQFTAATYSVAENSGQATITVARAGDNQGAISVNYATSDGTASTAPCQNDYTPTSGTLNWANGDSANKTFTIDINDDNRFEDDETITISLSNPTGNIELGTPDTAVLTITNDDSPPVTFDCTTVTGIPSAECTALISLYDYTKGSQWANNTGWKSTNTPCNWYGVTCKNGHVTRLKLQYNRLNGSISWMIGNLSHLEVLTLNNNQLRGNIPSGIGNLDNLWSLDLRNNQLSCSIPTEMGNLAQLQNLLLENNKLRGEIPASLVNLNNLSGLSLDTNHLEANDPALIAWLNSLNPTWETTQIPAEVQEDIIIDFGDAHGLWIQINECNWIRLHNVTAESMITANLDANDQDEVIIDFGSEHGIWVRMNNTSWVQLDENSPYRMVSGDIDGNDQDDIIIDFGDSISVWMNNSTWVELDTTLSSENMVTGDIDGNGQDEVIIDFGTGNGISVWMNNTTWVQLDTSTSENLATGDIDGNGQEDVIIDFGASKHLMAWMNNSSWVELHTLQSESLVTGDVDGNGQDEVIADFGAEHGILMQMNNGNWIQLHTISPKSLAVRRDINGQADIIVDFDCYGIWLWEDNSNWVRLHTVTSKSIVVGNVDGQSGMSAAMSSLDGNAQMPTSEPVALPLP